MGKEEILNLKLLSEANGLTLLQDEAGKTYGIAKKAGPFGESIELQELKL